MAQESHWPWGVDLYLLRFCLTGVKATSQFFQRTHSRNSFLRMRLNKEKGSHALKVYIAVAKPCGLLFN